jgi:hypothetical protein
LTQELINFAKGRITNDSIAGYQDPFITTENKLNQLRASLNLYGTTTSPPKEFGNQNKFQRPFENPTYESFQIRN